eukprot:497345_1
MAFQKDDEGKIDENETSSILKSILNTICFYSVLDEQQFSNTPKQLPQFPLYVGNAVRSITFSAVFDQYQLKNHRTQCLISIGAAKQSQDFNIVKYSKHIGVMGYAYDHYPNDGYVKYDLTKWNNYGIVYDGKDLIIYVNGEIDTKIDRKYVTANTLSQNNFIGQSNHSGCESPFYGKIKNLRFYGKNLSKEEIKIIFE